MKTGLYQTISPKLVLTPRLQQAISLLQMSNLELLFHIRQEMILNPFLEEAAVEENTEEEKKTQNDETLMENEKEESDENLKIEDWQELIENNGVSYEAKDKIDFFEKPIENKTSLIQHLMWQLQMSRLTPDERLLGEIIISEIDEKGYLRISLEELAKAADVPIKDMERVLKVIQTFEPAGVGARDLKECLLLQLGDRSENEKTAKILLEDYLEEIENKNYGKIAEDINKSLEEVERAADLISSLNPYPGSVLEEINNFYIVPDVIVDKVENEYVVTVNDDRLPNLGLNKYYLKLLKNKEKPSDVSEFLSKKFQSANWLLSCIEQRRMTLLQITKAVVKKQYEFFEKGLEYLCPLNLKQIADIVDMHESTVSRTVSNKYVQTPRGIFELKFFFLKGFNTIDNGSVPTLMVKESVRDIIKNEVTPLSDEEIAIILKQRGINIARRTVSKYRDELKIPTLNKRKVTK
ncbi:MAG: RNA polymerase factor sigma-54 [bacterium]|nr:RNA polymerase factor sigma-54 [bacterium]